MRAKVDQLDRELYKLLRAVGLLVLSMLFARVLHSGDPGSQGNWPNCTSPFGFASSLRRETRLQDWTHRKRVKYLSLFGIIRVESPYLWDKKTGRGARPVKDQLGIEHSDRSVAVQRARADFGAEESFGQASIRFEEHYGWAIDRATMRREVEHTALNAERYVEERLLLSRLDYSQPLETRPGNEQVLVELDGCNSRTGT